MRYECPTNAPAEIVRWHQVYSDVCDQRDDLLAMLRQCHESLKTLGYTPSQLHDISALIESCKQ